MNRYLDGTYALVAHEAMPLGALARVRPMTAPMARQIIGACLGAIGERAPDMQRQLTNMANTIAERSLEVLPDRAADALGKAVACIGDVAADDGAGAEADAGDDEDDSLIVDFGWHPEAVNEVLDADGDFESDTDGTFDIMGTTLGPRGRNVVVGVAVLEWDNHNTYQPGEVVYNDMRYWRALREVDPPLITAFMDGEVPGKSDSWREIPEAEALARTAVHGDEDDDEGEYDALIGMVDIGQAQLKMNELKPVTVGIAKSLIKGGLSVMAIANQTAKAHDLPLQTGRDEVVGHLQWHQNKLAGLPNDQAVYDSGDDAKKWAMQAFIEANSVEEGAAYLDEAWTRMWAEIAQALAALPRNAVQAIAKLPGQAFEAVTGIPSWAFWVGGAVILGGLIYGSYKILAGPAGGALVGHYLGGRR